VRTPAGWRLKVLTAPDHELELDAVEFRIALAQVYFDLTF
jgi:hypothetical protein